MLLRLQKVLERLWNSSFFAWNFKSASISVIEKKATQKWTDTHKGSRQKKQTDIKRSGPMYQHPGQPDFKIKISIF